MLTYSDTAVPGIIRRRRGKQWQYIAPDGARITEATEIDRLNALGVPPAYDRVWFSPDPAAHLQAIGYDAKGRKQYRYHADFRAARDAGKYDRCAAFGGALPKLRKAVERDIAARGLGPRQSRGGYRPAARPWSYSCRQTIAMLAPTTATAPRRY